MPDMLQLGIHGSRDGKRWGSYTRPLSCEDLREGFHTYSLEWTESELIWYFDGVRYAAKRTLMQIARLMYI